MIPWDVPVAARPIHATVAVPGSKSASARALVLAAIADGPSELAGLLDARDTRLMRDALTALGAAVTDKSDATVMVRPITAFQAGSRIDCGLSGTVMRFVPALAVLAPGTTWFEGDPGAERRPVAPLLDGLRHLGAEVAGSRLPFSVTGRAQFGGGEVILDSSSSSQFVTALLLAGARYRHGVLVRHRGPDLPSRPHLNMTVAMLRARGVVVEQPDPDSWRVLPGPIRALTEHVEPDLTNAATFAAAAMVTGGRVTTGWPSQSVQAGGALLGVLTAFGARVSIDDQRITVDGSAGLKAADVDLHEVSELTCVAAALAALSPGRTVLSGVAHIRGHETDRLAALARQINALGGRVTETRDGLLIEPSRLHGGVWATYADHRMAHAGALIGLAVPGVQLDDVGCTSKTLPDFTGLWLSMVGANR